MLTILELKTGLFTRSLKSFQFPKFRHYCKRSLMNRSVYVTYVLSSNTSVSDHISLKTEKLNTFSYESHGHG